MCFIVLASPGQRFVLLGSRLLWVPPHPLWSSAFLSWPLGDSLCFVREPASLDPPFLCVSLSRLLWDSIFSARIPDSLGSSLSFVCFCFSNLASLGQLCFIRDPASLGPSHLIVCFTVPASLGQHFVLLGSRLLWVPPQPLCASGFLS